MPRCVAREMIHHCFYLTPPFSQFMQYLADNGWEGEIGEDDDKELIVEKGVVADDGSDEKL
jgi:hypothetical protein